MRAPDVAADAPVVDLEGDLAPDLDLAPDAPVDAPPADLAPDLDAPPAAPAEPLAILPPTLAPTGDPMNDTKQALALEAKQLEKSIAAAKAAGQTARAEALEARRRVIARGAA